MKQKLRLCGNNYAGCIVIQEINNDKRYTVSVFNNIIMSIIKEVSKNSPTDVKLLCPLIAQEVHY